uniref:Transmembrane protein n=1 Tax=Cacopsylla melanoneura TaxID=428564 RepID=A0A8D8VX31_9HEMI
MKTVKEGSTNDCLEMLTTFYRRTIIICFMVAILLSMITYQMVSATLLTCLSSRKRLSSTFKARRMRMASKRLFMILRCRRNIFLPRSWEVCCRIVVSWLEAMGCSTCKMGMEERLSLCCKRCHREAIVQEWRRLMERCQVVLEACLLEGIAWGPLDS